jgi:hypothetical protein
MSRNRRLSKIGGIDPDIVLTAMMVQLASVSAQMPLQFASIHGNSLISASRRATADATISTVLA